MAEIKIGIYKITSPTGRIYIGQATDIDERWSDYMKLANCKQQPRLWNSLNKYTPEKHIYEVIHECTSDELNEMERYYQDLFSVTGKNGLNCILTSASDRKGEHSEETKKKIGKSLKGLMVGEKNPMFGRTGDKNPFWKKKHPSELQAIINEKKKGKTSGEKNGMFGIRNFGADNPFFEKKHSTESKAAMKVARKLRVTKDSTIIKLRRIAKERKFGTEFRDSSYRLNLSISHGTPVLDTETGIFYHSLKALSFSLGKNKGYARSMIKSNKKFIQRYLLIVD